MRVIAGSFGGRRLAAPEGERTRPTPDRVREALFSALESQLGGPGSLEGAEVLDLYAGSGALGLEALSRGARRAVFVEREKRALACVRDNVRALDVADRAEIRPGAASVNLAAMSRSERRFDVVFVDPPFESPDGERSLHDLGASTLLREGGVIVYEHPAARGAPAVPGLSAVRTRRYGTVALTTYVRAPADAGAREGPG